MRKSPSPDDDDVVIVGVVVDHRPPQPREPRHVVLLDARDRIRSINDAQPGVLDQRDVPADDGDAVGEIPVELAVQRRMIEGRQRAIDLAQVPAEILEQRRRADAARSPSSTPGSHVASRTRWRPPPARRQIRDQRAAVVGTIADRRDAVGRQMRGRGGLRLEQRAVVRRSRFGDFGPSKLGPCSGGSPALSGRACVGHQQEILVALARERQRGRVDRVQLTRDLGRRRSRTAGAPAARRAMPRDYGSGPSRRARTRSRRRSRGVPCPG